MNKIIVITSGKGGVGKSLGYKEYIALSNGDVIQIGPYIDNLIENNKTKVKQLIVQTTNGEEIFEVLEPPKELILNIVKNIKGEINSEIRNPIALMRKPAPKSLVKISTSNGTIEVTEEHKFLILREGKFIKIRADELSREDYLLEFNYPKTEAEYEEGSKDKSKLLGYLIGDGYIERRNNGFIIHIFSEEKNRKLIEDSFKKVFGSFKSIKDKRNGLIRTSYLKMDKVGELFTEYGVNPETAEFKEIPGKIFNVRKEICAAFLSALFDTDGHVCKYRNEIQYDTKSEKLALQIANLLRTKFRIESQLKAEYKKPSKSLKEKQKYFRITISGEDILNFYHEINFNIGDKKRRLFQKINSNFNTNIKLFPVGKLLKIIRDSSGITAEEIGKSLGVTKQMIYEYEWGFYALSKNSLKNFLEAFKKKGIHDERLEFLKNLLNKGYSFRKVQKIERISYNYPYVYDFQVCEEGGHFTHATGIVISNTTTAINLGAAINYFGGDVVVIDANLTTPNIGIHLNSPEVPVSLSHVLLKKAEVFESVYEHESGMKIIPSSLSVKEIRKINPGSIKDYKKDFKKIADYIIMDSSAGLGDETLSVLDVADEIIIVSNPEMPAIADALKTIKIAERMNKPITGVIITRVRKNSTEMQPDMVKEMLEIPILGMVPEDIIMQEALSLKNAVVHTHPKSKPARAYKEIAARIMGVAYDSDKDKESILHKILKKLKIGKSGTKR